MVVSFCRTIDIDCGGLPDGMTFPDVVPLVLEFFDKELQYGIAAVQACPGRVARVTFVEDGEAAKAYIEELGVVVLNGVECRVASPPPPPPQLTTVVISWFPFEGSNEAIGTALSGYRSVKVVRNQVWPGRPSVSTGSRIVQMVIRKEILQFIAIRGVRCKVWYRGQPLQCGMCRKMGHRSVECPLKGKCFKCQKEGHLARDCNVTAGTPAEVVEVSADNNNGETNVEIPDVSGKAVEVNVGEAKTDEDDNDETLECSSLSDEDESSVTSDDTIVSSEASGVNNNESIANSKVVDDGDSWTTVMWKRTKKDILAPSTPSPAGKSTAKKAQHVLPKGAVMAAMAMTRASTKLADETQGTNTNIQYEGVDPFFIKEDLRPSHLSDEQVTVLWEMFVAKYQSPPNQPLIHKYENHPAFKQVRNTDCPIAFTHFRKRFNIKLK